MCYSTVMSLYSGLKNLQWNSTSFIPNQTEPFHAELLCGWVSVIMVSVRSWLLPRSQKIGCSSIHAINCNRTNVHQTGKKWQGSSSVPKKWLWRVSGPSVKSKTSTQVKILCHDDRSAKHETRQGSNTNNQEESKKVAYSEEPFTIWRHLWRQWRFHCGCYWELNKVRM